MRRLSALPPSTEPIDPAFIAIATKIVRSTIGRRWFFHNRICVAFSRAPGSSTIDVWAKSAHTSICDACTKIRPGSSKMDKAKHADYLASIVFTEAK